MLRSQAVEFGFNVAELAQGFTRIQVGTQNTAKTIKLLSLAEDVARARHLGLAQAGVILAKASQGNDTSLRRLGIIIPKVTEHVDALRAAHDKAAAAGATFSKSQKLVYENAIANATAQDKEATKTRLIAEIQKRFGGQAAEFAKTAQGAFARFHESVNEFEVALGTALLPGLTKAALASAHFFKGLADNKGVASAAGETAHALGEGFHAVGEGLKEINVVAGPTAHLLKDITKFAGAGGILTAVVAYKALGFAVGVAGSVQARYIAVKQAGSASEARSAISQAKNAGTTEALATSTTELTAVVEANTAALAAQAEATGLAGAGLARYDAAVTSTTAATIPAVAANEALVASEVEVGAARGGLALFGAGLRSLVSPQTLVAVGAAAIAFGIYKLVSSESAWESANRTLRNSLEELGTTVKNLRDDESRLGDLKVELPTLRAAKVAAQLSVERDRLALSTSKAAKGSLEYRTLQNTLAQDEAQLASVSRDLSKAQDDAAGTSKKITAELKARSKEARQLVKDTLALAAAQRGAVASVRPAGRGAGIVETKTAAEALASYTKGLRDDAKAEQSRYPLLARNLKILADYADRLHHFPTRRETTVILNLKLGEGAKYLDLATGSQHRIGQGFAPDLAPLNKTVADTAKVVHDSAAAAATTITTSVKNYAGQIRAALQDAQYNVAQAQQGLADTIRQGAQAVADSVTSAKQNLNTIGGSLADAIGRFLDAKGTGGLPASATLTKEFKHLKDLIAAGADPEAIKKASDEVKAQLDARAAAAAGSGGDATKAKDHVKTALANLTDLLNKGAITREQFEKRVTKLLRSEGITRANILKKLGVAAADEFSGLLTGLKQQADALVKGPHQAGTGLIPAIVKPLDALRQAQKDTAAAQHSLQVAQRDLAKQTVDELKKIRADAERAAKAQAKRDAATKGTAFTASLVSQDGGKFVFTITPKPKKPEKKAGGGTVHGPAGRDVIPAMLTAGEVIFNEPQQHGLRGMLGIGPGSPEQLFQHVARHADGGVVAPARYATGGAAAPGPSAPARLPLGRYGVGEEIGHDAPRLWTIRGGHGAANPIPMRPKIGGWLEQFTGRGLSPAQAIDAREWWSEHWPSPRRYATGGAAAPGPARPPSARRQEMVRLINRTFTANSQESARIASQLLSLHPTRSEYAWISRYSGEAGDAAIKAQGEGLHGYVHHLFPALGHAADVAVTGGVIGDIRHGRHDLGAGIDALGAIPLLRPVKAARLALEAGKVAKAGEEIGSGVKAAEHAAKVKDFRAAHGLSPLPKALSAAEQAKQLKRINLPGVHALTSGGPAGGSVATRSPALYFPAHESLVIGKAGYHHADLAKEIVRRTGTGTVASWIRDAQEVELWKAYQSEPARWTTRSRDPHLLDLLQSYRNLRIETAAGTIPARSVAPVVLGGLSAAAKARTLRRVNERGVHTLTSGGPGGGVLGDRAPALYFPAKQSLVLGRAGWAHGDLAKVLAHRTGTGDVRSWLKEAQQVELWKPYEHLPARWATTSREPAPGLVKLLQSYRNLRVDTPAGIIPVHALGAGLSAAAKADRAFRLPGIHTIHDADTPGTGVFAGRAPALYYPSRGAVVLGDEGWGHGDLASVIGKRTGKGTFDWLHDGDKFAEQVELWKPYEGEPERWTVRSKEADKHLVKLLQDYKNLRVDTSVKSIAARAGAAVASAVSTVPKLPWRDPPALLGVRKGTGTAASTATGHAPGVLGDAVEHAITNLGFRGTHPGTRFGDFDAAWDHTKDVFEVKARTTHGTEYKYGFTKAAREKKLAAAAKEGLNPHTMIVVVDPDAQTASAYWRTGLSSSRLSRQWNYAGTTHFGVSHLPPSGGHAAGGVARLSGGGAFATSTAPGTFKPPARMSSGGIVPGPLGAGDIVPALLSPGEEVVQRGSRPIESGAQIAYQQRAAQLAEARRQTRVLERIADNQKPRARPIGRVHVEPRRSPSLASEMSAFLVGTGLGGTQ